jgi:hypothetical protein
MIARSIAMALLLNLVCQMSIAAARGDAGTADIRSPRQTGSRRGRVKTTRLTLCGPASSRWPVKSKRLGCQFW